MIIISYNPLRKQEGMLSLKSRRGENSLLFLLLVSISILFKGMDTPTPSLGEYGFADSQSRTAGTIPGDL